MLSFRVFALIVLAPIICISNCDAGEPGNGTCWHHIRDVAYGYKDGMALVLDIYKPTKPHNGAGIIRIMSGAMRSQPGWSHDAPNYRHEVRELLQRGYVVFAVAHGATPRYTIDEAHQDVCRCIRFVRHHADRFGIKPNRIGIMGASSGGHLSLLAATNPASPKPDAEDPVDRESARVQAVVSYYAGTDNLNFGANGVTIIDHFTSLEFPTPEFDFHVLDKDTGRFERVLDSSKKKQMLQLTSPITHVSSETPPILTLHGIDDKLVPIQQSEILISKLKKHGVSCRLLAIPNIGHGFLNGWKQPQDGEIVAIVQWFDTHLLGT